MPDLNFGDDLLVTDERKLRIKDPTRLGDRILAYLAWPEDAAARDRWMAARGARRIADNGLQDIISFVSSTSDNASGALKESGQKLVGRLERSQRGIIEQEFIQFGGGFGPVADASMNVALRRALGAAAKKALLAGYLVWLTWVMAASHADQLRGGASLNKSRRLMQKILREERVSQSKAPIEDAWRSHSIVAHIAAGALVVSLLEKLRLGDEAAPSPLERILESPLLVLAYAHAVQKFATTFRALRSPKSLLDQADIWRIPPQAVLRDVELPTFQLPEPYLSFLMDEYRAPVRR